MMRVIRMLVALATIAAPVALGSAAPGIAQATGGGYAGWTLAGSSGAYTGSVTLPAPFPVASFTSDSRAPAEVQSGLSNWIPAATPFGEAFGSSQDQPYLHLRPAADTPDTPSTTTYRFDSPTPTAGWGFLLGEIDADRVAVSATGPDGNPVPASGLGFEGAFNYCDASPRPSSVCSGGPAAGDPGFDIPMVVTAASSVELIGNGNDTGGAAGWFRPTVPLSTLTFVFTAQSGFPVYHTWFATDGSAPGAEPSPPPTGGGAELPATGGAPAQPLLVAGVLILAGVAVLLVVRPGGNPEVS